MLNSDGLFESLVVYISHDYDFSRNCRMSHDGGIVGLTPNTIAVGVERRREPQMNERSSSCFPFPFIGKVGGEVLLFALARFVFTKEPIWGYIWTLKTTSQAP